MKYLILGVNGMAGHMIAQYLKEKGHTVIGFARAQSLICDIIIGDACNQNCIIKLLKESTYDYVINCIGVLNTFVDEKPTKGIYLNSVLPHLLAEQLKETNTKLIHISTDCVFAGTKGAYTEKDIPDASSLYGRSKALGEVQNHKDLTIRTSIVGPELKHNGIGLFHWFMQQSDCISGYEKVIWSGVTTLQLAKAIETDIKTPQIGLYHLVNNQTISKYELLYLFHQYCRERQIEIQPEESVVSDKSLRNTKKTQVFAVPSYEQMVKEMGEWIQTHQELYPHYIGV